MKKEVKLEIQKRLDRIDKIYSEMLQHASTAGTVVDDNPFNNDK